MKMEPFSMRALFFFLLSTSSTNINSASSSTFVGENFPQGLKDAEDFMKQLMYRDPGQKTFGKVTFEEILKILQQLKEFVRELMAVLNIMEKSSVVDWVIKNIAQHWRKEVILKFCVCCVMVVYVYYGLYEINTSLEKISRKIGGFEKIIRRIENGRKSIEKRLKEATHRLERINLSEEPSIKEIDGLLDDIKLIREELINGTSALEEIVEEMAKVKHEAESTETKSYALLVGSVFGLGSMALVGVTPVLVAVLGSAGAIGFGFAHLASKYIDTIERCLRDSRDLIDRLGFLKAEADTLLQNIKASKRRTTDLRRKESGV